MYAKQTMSSAISFVATRRHEFSATTSRLLNHEQLIKKNFIISVTHKDKVDKRPFRVASLRLRSELPSDIEKVSTLRTFKKILKHSY